jgi:HEAT repeat protein
LVEKFENEAILAPLRDPNAPFEESLLRHSCVWALGRLGATTDELKKLLTQSLSDASVQVGREAAISLRLLFDNEALPDLARFLEESSVDPVNEQMLDFLADLSPNEIGVYR